MLKSTWLRRFTAQAKFSKVAPDKDTFVEITAAVPRIQGADKASVEVIGKAENSKYEYSGFLSKKYSRGLYEIVEKAADNGTVLLMRFERVRKKTADPTKTMDELTVDRDTAKDNVVKILTGIYNPKKGEWFMVQPVSDPQDDPEEVKRFIEEVMMGESMAEDADFFEMDEEEKEKQEEVKKTEEEKNTAILEVVSFRQFVREKMLLKNKEDEKLEQIFAVALLKISRNIGGMFDGENKKSYNSKSYLYGKEIAKNAFNTLNLEKVTLQTSKDDIEKMEQDIKNLLDWGTNLAK